MVSAPSGSGRSCLSLKKSWAWLRFCGLEYQGINALAVLLQLSAFRAGRRKRLSQFHNRIFANGNKGTLLAALSVLLVEQGPVQNVAIQPLGRGQVPDDDADMRGTLDAERMLAPRVA